MGGLRLFLQEPNNNSADPIDSEFPGTSPPSLLLPTPLTICRTVSCQNRAATLVATRAAAAPRCASLSAVVGVIKSRWVVPLPSLSIAAE